MSKRPDESEPRFSAEDSGGVLPPWLSSTLLWSVLGLCGWLVFELTAHPELSVVVVCLKFGLPDLANGWWLWRRDPDRWRGFLHGLAYVTLGLWWITVLSFLVVILIVLAAAVTSALLQLQNPPERAAWAALYTIGVFFIASVAGGLTTLGVTLAAYGLGVRLWLSHGMSAWRRRDEFPPEPDQPNLLPNLFETSLLVATLGVVAAVFITFLAQPLYAIGTVPLALATFAIVGARDSIKARVAATSPEDCWGSAENPAWGAANIDPAE